MKVTVFSAISLDGFIARKNDDTTWVSEDDWEVFTKVVKDSRAIAMGRKTFEVSGEDFPYDCELNVVMTHNKDLLKDGEGLWFTDLGLEEVVKEVEKRGFDKLLIIGGGKTNAAFMKAGLIDEVIIDIHPIILGNGISMFEDGKIDKSLVLQDIHQHGDGLVLATYEVKK